MWLSILTFDNEPKEVYKSLHAQTVFDIETGEWNGLALERLTDPLRTCFDGADFLSTFSSGPLINAARATRPRASLLLTVPIAQPVISAASA